MQHECANTLKPLKQVFSFTKESNTTTLTKLKPYTHVLSCSAMFTDDLFWRKVFVKRHADAA